MQNDALYRSLQIAGITAAILLATSAIPESQGKDVDTKPWKKVNPDPVVEFGYGSKPAELGITPWLQEKFRKRSIAAGIGDSSLIAGMEETENNRKVMPLQVSVGMGKMKYAFENIYKVMYNYELFPTIESTNVKIINNDHAAGNVNNIGWSMSTGYRLFDYDKYGDKMNLEQKDLPSAYREMMFLLKQLPNTDSVVTGSIESNINKKGKAPVAELKLQFRAAPGKSADDAAAFGANCEEALKQYKNRVEHHLTKTGAAGSEIFELSVNCALTTFEKDGNGKISPPLLDRVNAAPPGEK